MCEQLAKLWILGDKRGIPELQNRVVDAYHRFTVQTRRLNGVIGHFAYWKTREGSKWRAFIVELYALMAWKDVVQRKDCSQSADFLADLAGRLTELRGNAMYKNKMDAVETMDLCQFHVHETVDCKGREVVQAVAAPRVKAEDGEALSSRLTTA